MSVRSSVAIDTAPGLIRPAITSAERLASRASTKLTKLRQEMTATHGERRFAVEHKRYGEVWRPGTLPCQPTLPLWQPFRGGAHPHDPNAKHRAPRQAPFERSNRQPTRVGGVTKASYDFSHRIIPRILRLVNRFFTDFAAR
jgi:hypothetical protein